MEYFEIESSTYKKCIIIKLIFLFSCRKYYTPTSSLFISARRTCQNGQWSALNNKFQCEADCGNSASDTGAFIVGGSTAKAGKVCHLKRLEWDFTRNFLGCWPNLLYSVLIFFGNKHGSSSGIKY